MVLGLSQGIVGLRSYDPEWAKSFEDEKEHIKSALIDNQVRIEHIGSTSVPGLSAKPILDILLGIDSLDDGGKIIKPLVELGYTYKGEAGIPGRHFLSKDAKGLRTHHLHAVEVDGAIWRRHILFRDYLRKHKEAREEYGRLKFSLAERYPFDRVTYTDMKSSFIEKVIKKAEKGEL